MKVIKDSKNATPSRVKNDHEKITMTALKPESRLKQYLCHSDV